MSIPEKLVAEQLTSIIASQLLVPEIFDPLVSDVIEELKAALKREDNVARAVALSRLEEELDACVSALKNLVAQVERGPSDALINRIQERDRE